MNGDSEVGRHRAKGSRPTSCQLATRFPVFSPDLVQLFEERVPHRRWRHGFGFKRCHPPLADGFTVHRAEAVHSAEVQVAQVGHPIPHRVIAGVKILFKVHFFEGQFRHHRNRGFGGGHRPHRGDGRLRVARDADLSPRRKWRGRQNHHLDGHEGRRFRHARDRHAGCADGGLTER